MLRAAARLIAALILGITLPGALAATVVVSEFEDRTGENTGLGKRAQEEITSILVRIPNVTIVERSRMAQIMDEMNFSNSAYVDSATAAEFGKKAGADHVIFGSVSGISFNSVREKENILSDKDVTRGKAAVAITLQIVNVETNETVFSETVEGSAKDINDRNVVIPMALSNAIVEMSIPLQQEFPIRGYVIKTAREGSKYLVYVDTGRNAGVDKGRTVTVYSRGEEIVHPVTGEVLSASEGEPLLELKIDSAVDQFAIARVRKSDFNRIEVGLPTLVQPLKGKKRGKNPLNLPMFGN